MTNKEGRNKTTRRDVEMVGVRKIVKAQVEVIIQTPVSWVDATLHAIHLWGRMRET